jgi:hypothetical protein
VEAGRQKDARSVSDAAVPRADVGVRAPPRCTGESVNKKSHACNNNPPFEGVP